MKEQDAPRQVPTDLKAVHSKLLRAGALLLWVLVKQFVSRAQLRLKTPINLITSQRECCFIIPATYGFSGEAKKQFQQRPELWGSGCAALWLFNSQTSLTCPFLGAFWHLEPGMWQVPHCWTGVPPLESQIQILLCSGKLRKRMSVLSKVPMPCSSLPIIPPK